MATTTTLESEFLKRNTDCVYFLASPLTCKKGSECEYRHSDIARLNPRDCWYWLSGNCLNPTCAFRHPPLEGLTDTSSNPVHVAHHSIVNTSRTNVPCYFFFNTYCMKGDQCPFSHAMDDVSHAQKLPKAIAPEGISSHLLGNKASAGSDTGPAAVEVPENEGTSKGLVTESQAKDAIDGTAPNNISEVASPSHESPRSSNPDYEETIAKSPDNPYPEEKYVNGREDSFTDHSSAELVKDHAEADEWWESSPGFDVLVDDGSEQLAYEDDANYLQVQERESGRLHNHLMHYDYEDSAANDPVDYPDAEFVYGQRLYDACEHFKNVCAPDYALRSPEPSGEWMLKQMLHRKKRLSNREWDVQQHEVDLRDHLRKRRRVDAGLVSQNSRKHHPSHTRSAGQEHSERHGMRFPCLDSLSSELEREPRRNKVRSSHSESRSALDESRRRGGRLVYSHFDRPVVHSRNSEMQQPAFDENHRRLACRYFGRQIVHSRRRENRGGRGRWERYPSLPKVLAIKETRPTQVSVSSFSGPKIQSQFREEKRNVHAGRLRSENLLPRQQRRALSIDFEGPKSLSELLKDKKKFTSVGDSRNGAVTYYEQADRNVTNGYLDETNIHHGITDKLNAAYKSEFLHDAEDDDNDDDLATKVAGILA